MIKDKGLVIKSERELVELAHKGGGVVWVSFDSEFPNSKNDEYFYEKVNGEDVFYRQWRDSVDRKAMRGLEAFKADYRAGLIYDEDLGIIIAGQVYRASIDDTARALRNLKDNNMWEEPRGEELAA